MMARVWYMLIPILLLPKQTTRLARVDHGPLEQCKTDSRAVAPIRVKGITSP